MNVESGNKIRQLRLRKGITQDAQAKVLNVSFQTVSNWENNICMPDIQLLPEIAVYFGCTIDDLFSLSVQAQLQRIENMLEMQSTWNEDEFAQAVDFLTDKQAFVKKNPGYARGYLWLMDELIADYRLDETEMVCQQMAVLDESRRVPFCQGRIARVRGEHQRAEAIWKKCSRITEMIGSLTPIWPMPWPAPADTTRRLLTTKKPSNCSHRPNSATRKSQPPIFMRFRETMTPQSPAAMNSFRR